MDVESLEQDKRKIEIRLEEKIVKMMKQALDLVKREEWKEVSMKNKELKMINTEKKKIIWI